MIQKGAGDLKRILSGILIALFVLLAPLQAVAAGSGGSVIYAKAAIVMDANTGEILYAKNANVRMQPASLTKIMTCLLAIKHGQYTEKVRVTGSSVKLMSAATRINLAVGEEIPLSDLLYALMLPSANDAANTIAIHLGGSLSGFAGMMNQEAQALGASNTTFYNAHGLPDDRHLTTAYDLALITKAALEHPEFAKIAGRSQYTIPATNKSGPRAITHLNKMMYKSGKYAYQGAIAGKTGWTVAAGNCLMTTATRNGRTLICVVLNSSGVERAQYVDTIRLLNYGFNTQTVAPSTVEPSHVNPALAGFNPT